MQALCSTFTCPDGTPLQMRIGLVAGPGIGGVVGSSMLRCGSGSCGVWCARQGILGQGFGPSFFLSHPDVRLACSCGRYHLFGELVSEVTCFEQSCPPTEVLCSAEFKDALELGFIANKPVEAARQYRVFKVSGFSPCPRGGVPWPNRSTHSFSYFHPVFFFQNGSFLVPAKDPTASGLPAGGLSGTPSSSRGCDGGLNGFFFSLTQLSSHSYQNLSSPTLSLSLWHFCVCAGFASPPGTRSKCLCQMMKREFSRARRAAARAKRPKPLASRMIKKILTFSILSLTLGEACSSAACRGRLISSA